MMPCDPWYEVGVLNDAKIKAAKPKAADYKLADSGQLFLHVTKAGGRHWRMNYSYGKNANGKPAQKTLTFGPYGIAAGVCDSDPAASLGKALKEVPKAKPQPSIVDGLRDQAARLDAIRELLVKCDAETARASTKFALRLIALTAVRPGELRFARWEEFEGLDGDEPIWRIPAARMKGDADRKTEEYGDHLVPLSRQAVEVLQVQRRLSARLPVVFPSDRHMHRPISENTLRALLIRAGYYQRHVPHGFRAAFSTYMNDRLAADRKEGDRAVIDLMLAHVPKDKVEGAYNRAGYMDRRRELAQEWADLISADLAHPETLLGMAIKRS